ncbi:MAG: class I SAM-dependent methyltransferase [Oligoflexales bacterium]
MSALMEIIRCPRTGDSKCSVFKDKVVFDKANKSYIYHENVVDFVDYNKSDFGYERAVENWGENLHKECNSIPETWHHDKMRQHFGEDLYVGNTILEIGCGPGYDLYNAANKSPAKEFIGLDLGENLFSLGFRDRNVKNIRYVRCDALNLPFQDECIDSIVSFGVFHHTPSPQKCMKEAHRVLKRGGKLSIYLYKNHEDNFLKWIGVIGENIIMRITKNIPHNMGKKICYFLAPFMLLFFSWPAQLLKIFPITRKLGNKFPMHWGNDISSIIGDLEDRLLAPVNHRYSKQDFEKLFTEAGFQELKIVTTTEGHYGLGKKKTDQ